MSECGEGVSLVRETYISVSLSTYFPLPPSSLLPPSIPHLPLLPFPQEYHEYQNLLVMPPSRNMWLIGAILLSMTQHFIILYIPFPTMSGHPETARGCGLLPATMNTPLSHLVVSM